MDYQFYVYSCHNRVELPNASLNPASKTAFLTVKHKNKFCAKQITEKARK